MTIKFKKIFTTSLFLLCITSALSVQAGWIETDIIKLKANRLYLDAGYDQFVLPDGLCRIINGIDTIAISTIEEVLPAISYTSLLDYHLVEYFSVDSIKIQVESYDIDSTSEIEIFLPQTNSLVKNSGSLYLEQENLSSPNGNSFKIYEVEDNIAIPASSTIHGLVEFSRPNEKSNEIFHAPFIAILMPELNSKLNDHGVLSTALYYNFNDSLHPLYNFDGKTDPIRSFDSWKSSSNRAYAFDPIRGKKLLSQCTNSNSKIRLTFNSYQLNGVSDFFADYLAAERVQVNSKHSDPKYDLLISWVSFDVEKSITTLKEISDFLNREDLRNSDLSESVELLSHRVLSAMDSNDSSSTNFYTDLIERSFYEDFGIFPLFRPYLIFRSHELLRGVIIKLNGKLDLSNAILLKRPDQEEIR